METTMNIGDIYIQKKSKRKFAGPFIDEHGRLVFELKRRQTESKVVLDCALADRASFGRHVAKAVARGYNILEGNQVSGNRQAGIATENGIHFKVSGNTFQGNGHGVLLWSKRVPEFELWRV
jgi:parallel beta-helix repeat protein